MKKLSIQGASLAHALVSGIVIILVIVFAFGVLIGIFQGVSNYQIPNNIITPIVFVVSMIAYWFVGKYGARYLNSHYSIENGKKVSFFSTLYILIVVFFYYLFTTYGIFTDLNTAKKIGYTLGLIVINLIRISPFYFASKKYFRGSL